MSGSGISWAIYLQVCTLLQTENHASTPPLSCRPANSVKALKAHRCAQLIAATIARVAACSSISTGLWSKEMASRALIRPIHAVRLTITHQWCTDARPVATRKHRVWTTVLHTAWMPCRRGNCISNIINHTVRYKVKKGKGSRYSITEHRIPELIPVLSSQHAGDVSHKPGDKLSLLSTRPAVTLTTLKRAATNFAAWWTEARWVWTVCLRLLPDSVGAAIWTQALLCLNATCQPLGYRVAVLN